MAEQNQDQDQDQKTEEASDKKLEEARQKGQIPVSREVASWVSLLGVLVMVAFVSPHASASLGKYLGSFLEYSYTISLTQTNFQALFFSVIGNLILILGIAFCVMIVFVILGYMIQTGFFMSLDLLEPNFSKLSPINGLKKMFSMQSVVELFKSLLKLLLLGSVAYLVLMSLARESMHFSGGSLSQVMPFLYDNLTFLIKMLLLVFLVIAAFDLFWTRFQYFRKLRMTKTEVKEEYKQSEGDPMIKSRLRQIRMEKSRKRMMAEVPKADVVITNPTHYAVALKYNALKMRAPVVVAKGINLIALRIREAAEEHKVPIVSNPPLARTLHSSVDIDEEIHIEHYKAVAEIISYVYKTRKK
ncbi:MAG: flagellar biosynthesis protein FlhB [Alphaproteobacteria bacterium]|nr:flagellar biosynthesis protein FlhB [Alphaproteobacteria bacterium]MCL2505116.1 flagellar biosynthesis protein FlhB [Alphaproteobacteria bacterium]